MGVAVTAGTIGATVEHVIIVPESSGLVLALVLFARCGYFVES